MIVSGLASLRPLLLVAVAVAGCGPAAATDGADDGGVGTLGPSRPAHEWDISRVSTAPARFAGFAALDDALIGAAGGSAELLRFPFDTGAAPATPWGAITPGRTATLRIAGSVAGSIAGVATVDRSGRFEVRGPDGTLRAHWSVRSDSRERLLGVTGRADGGWVFLVAVLPAPNAAARGSTLLLRSIDSLGVPGARWAFPPPEGTPTLTSRASVSAFGDSIAVVTADPATLWLVSDTLSRIPLELPSRRAVSAREHEAMKRDLARAVPGAAARIELPREFPPVLGASAWRGRDLFVVAATTATAVGIDLYCDARYTRPLLRGADIVAVHFAGPFAIVVRESDLGAQRVQAYEFSQFTPTCP